MQISFTLSSAFANSFCKCNMPTSHLRTFIRICLSAGFNSEHLSVAYQLRNIIWSLKGVKRFACTSLVCKGLIFCGMNVPLARGSLTSCARISTMFWANSVHIGVTPRSSILLVCCTSSDHISYHVCNLKSFSCTARVCSQQPTQATTAAGPPIPSSSSEPQTHELSWRFHLPSLDKVQQKA